MTGKKPPPEVLSLILCDQIITDRLTGKQSLIGMLSAVHARRFPAAHPQLCVHVMLTSGRGKTDFMIRIVDADDARPPVVEGRGGVDFKDPRAVASLSLQFHGIQFPQRGSYRVQLYSDGQLLREARLDLVLVRPPRQGSGGDAPPEKLN